MIHKYLQPLRFPLVGEGFSGKTETMEAFSSYLVNERENFKDNEEIVLRYKNEYDVIVSSVAIVEKNGDNITFSVSISDDETLKIVQTENEPNNKKNLWLTDGTSLTPEEFKKDLDGLWAVVRGIQELLYNSELTTGVIEGGNIKDKTTSEREFLMSLAEPIIPPAIDPKNGESEIITSGKDKDEAEEIKPELNTKRIRHVGCSYAEKIADLKTNLLNYINNELIICYEDYCLYTKVNGNIVKLSGTGGGYTPEEEEEIMKGINTRNDCIESIRFIAPSNTEYLVGVNDNGELYVHNTNLDNKFKPSDYVPDASGNTKIILLQDSGTNGALYINSVYCGGVDKENAESVDVNEHSYNPCSHNFVELSNMTKSDINLSGFTLNYAETGDSWKELKLKGIIKKYSTFLIRGAQCSVMDANTTRIKVKTYDMEWYDGDKLIQFSNRNCKFYLRYVPDDDLGPDGKSKYLESQPYHTNDYKYGFTDLAGFQNTSDAESQSPGGFEKKLSTILTGKRLLYKYYDMDNVKQANKAATARTNSGEWVYIDLEKEDLIPNVESFTPKASFENKNVFFNKTTYNEDKPSLITCSFGIRATDDGSGATRCFNWVSKGYYDEHLWISTNSGFTGDFRFNAPSINGNFTKDQPEYYYNRIRQESTNGIPFTVHKQVVSGLTAGVYYYIAGRADSNGNPDFKHCTNVRKFEVKATSDIINSGFTFIQTSDQQGFNWNEYLLWKYSSKYAKDFANKELNLETGEGLMPDFMINTGDMTQNGNRPNEWLDYFNGKEFFDDMVEMATIGNNDLCGTIPYEFNTGEDIYKINPINITFYYTFEMDPNNMPVFDVYDGEKTTKVYVPSLYSFNYGNVHFMCINSELTKDTENEVFGLKTNAGTVYKYIETWCQNDINNASDKYWKVAYCHEMPYTIMTDDRITGSKGKNGFLKPAPEGSMDKYAEDSSKHRDGSHLNTLAITGNEYWFSEFCQENGIRLVFGGHKHTQATTWPIKENVEYTWVIDGHEHKGSKEDVPIGIPSSRIVKDMKPIIQVTAEDLQMFSITGETVELFEINEPNSVLYGYKYPSSWCYKVEEGEGTGVFRYRVNPTDENKAHLCTFELVSSITAPVYAMSQATAYKHTSNVELPSHDTPIPWLRYYYPADSWVESTATATANPKQRFPFYTIWHFTSDKIEGYVKKVAGLFDSDGKFDINKNGKNLFNGISNAKGEGDPCYNRLGSVNGLGTDIGIDSTEHIIINK